MDEENWEEYGDEEREWEKRFKDRDWWEGFFNEEGVGKIRYGFKKGRKGRKKRRDGVKGG